MTFSTPIICHEKPFVMGHLEGQLGNQFFIVAATLALAWDNDAIPVFPDFKKRRNPDIQVNYKNVFWRLITEKPNDQKVEFRYHAPRYPIDGYLPIPYQPNMVLYGYFQSEKYFAHHKERIKKTFEPSEEIVDYLVEKYGNFFVNNTTVSIHIRMYKEHREFYFFHGRDYIKRAISLFPKNVQFIVCSDDIEWCKENLSDLAKQMLFIENQPHYYDFYLMSMCDHNIITNSSFSWWAVYLNKNPKKIVVAPEKWYRKALDMTERDLIPDGWIQIN